jgi:hypothetical protein
MRAALSTALPFGALILSLLGPTHAPAQSVVAAGCPGPFENYILVGNGNFRLAQTFTPEIGGNLTTAQLEVVKPAASAGDWVIQVNAVDGSGAPANTVLATTTVPNASVPDGQSTLQATFANPATVTAGVEYALVMSRPGGAQHRWNAREGNDCPGALFFSGSQTGPFQSASFPGFDGIFAVFVEPLPEVPADRILTLDANKNRVKKGRMVTLTGRLTEIVRQACQSGQTVDLQRKKPSQAAFTTVEQLHTDAAGSFSARKKVKKTFQYRAQVAETATCAAGTSNTEKVKVKKTK